MLILLSYILKKTQGNKDKPEPEINRPRVANNRRNVLDRNRGARLRAAAQRDNEEPAQEQETETPDFGDMKIGTKKRAKLEAKAEKKAQREAEEHLRSEKKKRDQQLEEARKSAEEKEKQEQAKREAEEKRAREEKERKEHEEYLKMKEAFMVEEEGFEEDEEESQNLLQEFIQHIKKEKVIVIENLAAQFKMKSQTAVERIQDLQKDNILTGIIDDRGKFIYISQEEMEDIAKFIRQRGRVSLSDIVENSNRLINLTPVN